MSLLRKFRNRYDRVRIWRLRRFHERALPVSERLRAVLSVDPTRGEYGELIRGEHCLPTQPEFLASGHTHWMLARYLLALDAARGRRVLDCCSGYGWGAHIVSSVAGSVVCLDFIHAAQSIARRLWKDGALLHVDGDAVRLPFRNESFDVVCFMEAIEHFDRETGLRIVGELWRVLRPAGRLFGSTPIARSDAEIAAGLQNPSHKHIYREPELIDALSAHFRRVRVTMNLFFRAEK